jgi:2-polyprenyl-3-methyl-5-hydroxy-6-metoxy-1,4-benzoquinol methylase
MPYYTYHSKNTFSTHSHILELIGKDKTVLDVGCNKGYIGEHADKTNTFYGLEYDEVALKIAKGIYTDVQQYDLNNLKKVDFKVQKFDVIIFADVLEHVLYPDQVLEYFKTYLADGGYIVISLPNIANWQVRLNMLFGKFDYTETGIMDRTHLHLYTFKSAQKLAASQDFVVTEVRAGASFFGRIIAFAPFLKGLLATNIIMKVETKK